MDWYKHDAKAFNSSTADMSLVDRGAYITLLNQQWDREGYLPADEHRIFRMVGAFTEEEQGAVRRVLAEKFELTDHGYANGRMLKTIREAQEKSAKARKAAYARHADAERTQSGRTENAGGTRARARRASSLSSLSSDSAGEGEPEGESDFDRFWEAYPRKVKKRDARKAWKQTEDERPPTGQIVDKLRRLKRTPDWSEQGGRFIPYPATWLRGGGWDDDPEALGGVRRERPDEDDWRSVGNGYWVCRHCDAMTKQWREHECLQEAVSG